MLANPYSFGSYSYPENCPKLLANVVKVPARGFEPKNQMSRAVNYHALTVGFSRFIDTLACGILAKYSNIAEAFSSLGVSPTFHRESPSFNITIAEATS
ncbi:MAG: hypothetical protein RXO71_02435 [Nitrososphaeria archaeon]